MSAIDQAKETLLRTLDKLEQAEHELDGEPERVDLVVIYSIGRDKDEAWDSVSGWAATPGPKWVHSALLRRAADAHDEIEYSRDDDDGE